MRAGCRLSLRKGGGMNWLEEHYLWLKAGHVIFVIFWMASMFMLPRYLAYHSEVPPGSAESEAWKTRERRLLRIIVNPSMVLTWLFGIALATAGHWWQSPWLHGKVLLVLALSGFHGYLAGQVRKFGRDQGLRNSRTWRMLNEIPSLTVILVVILVVVKPF